MWRVKVSWKDKEGKLRREDMERDSIEAALDSLQASICEEDNTLIEENLLELHISKVMEPPNTAGDKREDCGCDGGGK